MDEKVSYGDHAKEGAWNAAVLLVGFFKCTIHTICPYVFQDYTSQTTDQLTHTCLRREKAD